VVQRSQDIESYLRDVTNAVGFDLPVESSADPFIWKDADTYRPPIKPTPLTELLDEKTVAQVLVLTSACMFIACRRLMLRTDVLRNANVAEALFCFSVKPAYFSTNFGSGKSWGNTPEENALRALGVCTVKTVETVDTEQMKKMSSVPLLEVHPILVFTRQIIGQSNQEAFDTWFSSAIHRLEDTHPSLPDDVSFADFETREEYQAHVDACFGSACPFEALNPGTDRTPETDNDQITEYLGSLSSQQNNFLSGL